MKRSIAPILATLAAACAELPSISPGLDQEPLGGEPVQLARLQEYFPAYNSGFEERTQLVVRTQAEWEQAWRRMWKNHSPVPAAPAVDFEREVLVLAAMGTRSSGGYRVQVQHAAAHPDHVVVRVIETSPGGGCVTTAALSEPVDVARLPRTDLPIRFRVVETVHECR
ncbi:MAG TPA: protease complex subunit PrcB family protein [Longimicrobium sp.]|nr:protease complex subunit PrcB family protein [Longimicrobium sp.]